MRLYAALLFVALPSAALAQVTQFPIDIKIGAQDSVALSQSDCGRDLTINFTISAQVVPCTDLKIWSTSAESCSDEPGSGDRVQHTQKLTNTTTTGSFQLAVADLQATGGDGGVCDVGSAQQTYRLCGSFKYDSTLTGTCIASSQAVSREPDPPTITFDAKPPSPPELFSAVGHDKSLTVELSVDEDTNSIVVTAVDTVDGTTVTETAPTGSRVNVEGLTNGHAYTVTAVARDLAGNESDVSNEIEGTPVAIGGFYNRYVDAGGNTGGCSASGVGSFGAIALLAAAALMFRRRSAR